MTEPRRHCPERWAGGPVPYGLLPARRSRNARRPPGWVDLGNMVPPYRRRIDDGYLRQRLARDRPIGYNQAYVRKVLENPRSPECNRRAVVAFVRDHPERFMPLARDPFHPEYDQWVDGYNGNAVGGFVREILKRFG